MSGGGGNIQNPEMRISATPSEVSDSGSFGGLVSNESDSFFNIETTFGQANDEAMKDLYSEFVEMVGTLPEIVLEDNLDIFS